MLHEVLYLQYRATGTCIGTYKYNKYSATEMMLWFQELCQASSLIYYCTRAVFSTSDRAEA